MAHVVVVALLSVSLRPLTRLGPTADWVKSSLSTEVIATVFLVERHGMFWVGATDSRGKSQFVFGGRRKTG